MAQQQPATVPVPGHDSRWDDTVDETPSPGREPGWTDEQIDTLIRRAAFVLGKSQPDAEAMLEEYTPGQLATLVDAEVLA